MTIHKSQGSQADVVTVLLPDEESRLLTRELFYTAVTRAQDRVRVVGSGARGPGRGRPAGPARERAAGAAGRVVTAPLTGSGTAAHAAVPETPAQRAPLASGHAVPAARLPARRPRVAGAARDARSVRPGGDIEAIEIVEKRHDGTAVDDVLLEMAPRRDARLRVSACNALDGVEVLWINRYAAGGNLFLDLEAVEDLTAHPRQALDRLVDLLPITFRVDWARADRTATAASSGAPRPPPRPRLDRARAARPGSRAIDDVTLLCGAPASTATRSC